VDIDMNTGFEDSLKQLKLEDGVGGVQKLRPADEDQSLKLTGPHTLNDDMEVLANRIGQDLRDLITAVLIERPFTLPSLTLLMYPRLS
jgi:hypothetical protein